MRTTILVFTTSLIRSQFLKYRSRYEMKKIEAF